MGVGSMEVSSLMGMGMRDIGNLVEVLVDNGDEDLDRGVIFRLGDI